METYSKRKITKKISKIDRDLKHLEKLLPQGIVKETLVAEIKNKKRPLSRQMTQELKRQKMAYNPKETDEKVNFIFQLISPVFFKKSCMRLLFIILKILTKLDKIVQKYLISCTMLSNIDEPTDTSLVCLHLL